MTMEPIQSTAAAYQGSGVAVEKTQSVPKAEIKTAEGTVSVEEQTDKVVAEEVSKQEDKVTMHEKD